MPRILPTAFLLSIAAAGHAQQADLPAAPAADSLTGTRGASSATAVMVSHERPLPPFTTILPALSRIAGVQVTPYSGAPGAWSTVRIRGVANATGYSQPLYVVDGVPVYNTEVTPEKWSNAEAFYNRNQGASANATPYTPTANPLLDMPVEDIEQVEILKGAAATARYGIQGTNGVILISTRRGGGRTAALQPLQLRYSGWAGVQQVRQRYEVLGARQYANLANVAALSNNAPAPYSPADIDGLQDADWQDQVLRVAGVQSHNLSVDGRTRNTNYYVAADYLRQTGVVKGSDLSRYHLRANLDQQLTGKLRVGLKTSASQTDERYAGRGPHAESLLQDALLSAPFVPTSGTYALLTDPLQELKYYSSAPHTRRFQAQVSATYHFNPDWQLSVRGSREQADTHAPGSFPEYTFGTSPSVRIVQGILSKTSSYNWVADAALDYQHAFGSEHALTATLTYLRQQFGRKLERTQESSNSRNGYSEWIKGNGVHSPAARFGYTYAGRYEVQASLRADMAFNDNFSKGVYYWFPGAQASWHLNKESFLAEASGLSDLTLWAGTGRTSSYIYATDRTMHHDAGLRIGLLRGLLTLEIGAYQRRTSRAEAKFAFAYANPAVSELVLLNRGLELTVGSTWQRGTVSGTTQLAAATNRNRVSDTNGGSFVINGNSELKEGQSVSSYRVYKQDGTFPAGSPNAGKLRLRDSNNDGSIDLNDTYIGGTGLPRYTLNLQQQLRFQRFQLEAQVDGLFGYKILNTTLQTLDTPTGTANSSERALDYWTPANQSTLVPLPGSSPSSFRVSDQGLANGDHLRLSQLTLSYEVLNTDTRKISVWVGGQNLFVTGQYRGFDPNVSSGGTAPLYAGQDASVYPVVRVWQVGVRGQF